MVVTNSLVRPYFSVNSYFSVRSLKLLDLMGFAPERIGRNPKGNDRLPIIHFSGAIRWFQGG